MSELVHHQTSVSYTTSGKRSFEGKVHVDRDDLLRYFGISKRGRPGTRKSCRLSGSADARRSSSMRISQQDPQEVFDQNVLPLMQLSSCGVSTNLKQMNTRELSDVIENYDEVADLVGLSRNVIRKYIKTGKLHAIKIGGKYLIPADELDNILRGANNDD